MMRPVGARRLIVASVAGLIVLLLVGGAVLAGVEGAGFGPQGHRVTRVIMGA